MKTKKNDYVLLLLWPGLHQDVPVAEPAARRTRRHGARPAVRHRAAQGLLGAGRISGIQRMFLGFPFIMISDNDINNDRSFLYSTK